MNYKLSNIGIVVLNFNGKILLEKFLPDLIKYSSKSNIYIIDNNSTDNSLSMLKKDFKKINIIELNKNYGYSKGYNEGMKDIDDEIICLINNDVKVFPNWIDPIVDFYNKNDKVAILQPHILSLKNKEKFEYAGAAGGYIDKLGYPFCKGRLFNYLENDNKQYDNNYEVFWSSGACFFIKNKIFKSLKGFDEDFFAHQEEIDLCWRAKIKGNQVWSIYKSKVYHLGGGTIQYNHPKKTYLNHRNNLFMLIKNLPDTNFINVLLKRLFYDYLTFFWYLLNLKPKHSIAIIRAHLSMIFSYNKMKRKRLPENNLHNYFTINNLPYNYFIKGLKKYTDLKVNKNNFR